jgi:hypothetical protein
MIYLNTFWHSFYLLKIIDIHKIQKFKAMDQINNVKTENLQANHNENKQLVGQMLLNQNLLKS